MGLAETQRLLARLYTDARVRDAFFQNPAAVAAEFSIPAPAAAQLAQLHLCEITRFARALQNKRCGDLAKLLPHTRRALGREFTTRFLAWSESTAPATSHRSLDDARQFAAQLLAPDAAQTQLPPWLLALVRYESAALQAGASRRCFVLRWFPWSIADLQKCARSPRQRAKLRRRPGFCFWWRLTATACLRFFSFALPPLPERPAKSARTRRRTR